MAHVLSKLTSSILHHCEISDSFVHPDLKLSNGKNGNGESRLFISNNKDFAKTLVKKPWLINFDENYINDINDFLEDDLNFRKEKLHGGKRKIKTLENICKINGEKIYVQLQNGSKDVNRNYVSHWPHRKKKDKTLEEKKNIKMWDLLRKSIIPTKTTFIFKNKCDYIEVYITHNNDLKKYNKIHGCSFAQLEFLDTFARLNNIEIQSAKTREFAIRSPNGYFWPVDGFHNCSQHQCCGTKENPCIWNNTVFEFQGDYWHKNKKEKDLNKKRFYESKGYKWFEITESQWNTRKKTIKLINKL